MEPWNDALKIFLFGFSGVFIGLILLMCAIQTMAFFIRLFTAKGKQSF
ncbi:MAG: hypothetical protein FJ115_05500 [Deltaproteobacteria bacterium]|nr:hypothetical protein [Deltaproteobacteria bacterium]